MYIFESWAMPLTSPLSVDISKDGPMNLWSATTAPVTEEILTAPWMCPEQKISPELVVMFKEAVLILLTWTEPVSAVTWQKSHSIKSDTSTLASSKDATLTLWTTGAWKKVVCYIIKNTFTDAVLLSRCLINGVAHLLISESLSTLPAVFQVINGKFVHPPHWFSCNKRKNEPTLPVY